MMNLHEHKEIIAISSLLIIVIAITLFLLNIDLKMGVYYVRDVYGYLNNALFFAGLDSGVERLRGLSPFIPMLTSIFFRMGFISDGTIMIVSSVFYIFSALGMYLMLRLRFNELLSLAGSLILSTFSINLVWVSKGMLDIPGLCLSIWIIYFAILSFNRNPRFLYLTSSLTVIGFFTRYTVALVMPVILIQLFILNDPIKFIKTNIRPIIISILIGIITLAIFLGIYHFYNLPMFFLSQTQSISSSTATGSATPIQNNLFYYLNNILIYVSATNFIPYSLQPGHLLMNSLSWSGGQPTIISYVFAIICIIGMTLSFKKLFEKDNRKLLEGNNNKYKQILLVIGMTIFLITYTKISIFASIFLLALLIIVAYKIFNKTEIEHLSLDFIFLSWFLINFIFFTYHPTKVDRYAITFTPFLAYLIILSLDLIFERLKSKEYVSKIKIIFPIGLLFAVLICSGYYCLINEPHTFDNQVTSNIMTSSLEENAVGEWLVKYDPNYKSKVIWADRGGDMSFILKKNIPSLDHISNTTDFSSTMIKENVTYFISKDNKTNLNPYVKLYQNGEVSLYQRK